MRRIERRHAFRDAREMRHAGHAHVAVAPRLARRPLHRFVHVPDRLRVDVSEDAAGFVRSRDVDDDQRVSTAYIKIKIACFHEAARVRETDRHQFHGLRGLRVRVHGEQRGKFSRRVRPENIRVERNSLTHGNRDVALDRNPVFSRRGLPLGRKHASPSGSLVTATPHRIARTIRPAMRGQEAPPNRGNSFKALSRFTARLISGET